MSALAALLMSMALSGPQDAPRPSDPEAARLEDIEILGQRDTRDLETRIDSFVGAVAAPIPHYGPARWNTHFPLCVGAVNFQPAAARAIVDRVASVALEVGIRAGEPGCKPHVLVFATNNGAGMASALVDRDYRLFVPGGPGMNLGRSALARFQTGERAVRWWHVSVPVDADTGQRRIRLPGDAGPFDENPLIAAISNASYKFTASRLVTQERDQLRNVVIIVDTDQLGSAGFEQVADYVAFVALTQVDPEVDVAGHPSVLAAFDSQRAPTGLTDWDRAYLRGLYDARLDRAAVSQRLGAVERGMERVQRAAQPLADAGPEAR